MQDDLQSFRILEMDRCVADFQLPCRWVPDAGYGYGYPQFNFYPPSVYYLGEVFHLTGLSYIDSVKLLFILGYIVSAVLMFVLVNELAGPVSGVVASVLYTYVPYKAVEVYVRGALSEFWALSFFPLLFWASLKLVKYQKTKYFGLLALASAGLLMTHTLMSIIFFPVLLIWITFWLVNEAKKSVRPKNTFINGLFSRGVKVASSIVFGIGLSAFFVLPVIFEKKFVHSESLLGGYFDYRQHFVNLYRLFISREWGYGSSGFVNEKLNLSTGLIQWTFALVVVSLAVIRIKKHKTLSLLVFTISAIELVVLFMIHQKSSFIWSVLPVLFWLQFPWRFLSVSIFLLSLIGGLGVGLIKKGRLILSIIVCVLAVILNIGFFTVKEWYVINDAGKFSGASWIKQITISIFDYTPIYATLPPPSEAPKLPEVVSGKVEFIDYQKASNFQTGRIISYGNSTLRVPLFDFPGMKVYVDGKEVSHWNNDCRREKYCLGLITFNVKKGIHELKVQLEDTPIRRFANLVSVGTLSLLFFIILFTKNNERKIKK